MYTCDRRRISIMTIIRYSHNNYVIQFLMTTVEFQIYNYIQKFSKKSIE